MTDLQNLEDQTEPQSGPAIQNGLEQTVMPSPNVVQLNPTTREQHLTRFADPMGTATERYLLSARVHPWQREQLSEKNKLEPLKDWFFESERTFVPTDRSTSQSGHIPLAGLPQPIQKTLGMFGPEGPLAKGLYACDISIVTEDCVLGFLPGKEQLVIEHRLKSSGIELVTSAVSDEDQVQLENSLAMLVFSIVPARYGVVLGERGFKRTLLEAGTTVTNTATLARDAGLDPLPLVDFVDSQIDDICRNDGVERTAIAIIALRTPEAPQTPHDPNTNGHSSNGSGDS